MKYLLYIILGIVTFTGIAYATAGVPITVPSAPGAGYCLISTTTGQYVASTTPCGSAGVSTPPGGFLGQLQFNNSGSFAGTSTPVVTAIIATSTTATSTISGKLQLPRQIGTYPQQPLLLVDQLGDVVASPLTVSTTTYTLNIPTAVALTAVFHTDRGISDCASSQGNPGDLLSSNGGCIYWVAPSAIGNFKSGTYTGDGGGDQSITGVGFQPTYMKIYSHNVPSTQTEVSSEDGGFLPYSLNDGNYTQGSIESLDADGFTVLGAFPSLLNDSGMVYTYIAWK